MQIRIKFHVYCQTPYKCLAAESWRQKNSKPIFSPHCCKWRSSCLSTSERKIGACAIICSHNWVEPMMTTNDATTSSRPICSHSLVNRCSQSKISLIESNPISANKDLQANSLSNIAAFIETCLYRFSVQKLSLSAKHLFPVMSIVCTEAKSNY